MGSVLLIILAVAGLLIGSEVAVKSAKDLAKKLGVSRLTIGLTVTSIGTSLPEIATNMSAGVSSAGGVDASGIAVGNVIGSNLSQITLLLGITALVAPLLVPRRAIDRDGPMMIIAMGLMFWVSTDGVASQLEGALLILAYAAYLTVLILSGRPEAAARETDTKARSGLWIDVLLVVGGVLILVFAADLIVAEGVAIARSAEVSEVAIGLMVGIATGLPELSVAVRAVREDAGDLALGNLIGSNITDPLLSFGAGAAVHGVTVPASVLSFDFPFWLAGTLIALSFLAFSRGVSRLQAVALLLVFVSYVVTRQLFVGL